jgi:prepilin-type N-terminal cleavage/methylation domain-containing protein
MKSKGFTLIELIMVIVLSSILASIGSYVLLAGFKAWFANQNVMAANNQARMALERMTRDIHAVASAASITTATASQFTFTNIGGTSITYQRTGSQLMRNTQVLADNISSLSFSYLDRNAATTAVLANIRYISISLVISQGSAQYPMRTTLYTMNYY